MFSSSANGSFEFWRSIWRSISDAPLVERSSRSFLARFDADSRFSSEFLESAPKLGARAERFLFALQTFAAQTIFSFVSSAFELSESERFEIWGATPFDWGEPIRPLLAAAVSETLKSLNAADSTDFLADFYGRLLPAEQRRALGEFYTPSPLAAYLLDRALASFAPGVDFAQTAESVRFPSILDPTCGDGAFLTPVLQRRLATGADSAAILGEIAGFDISPLAVLAARARLAFAATTSVPPKKRPAELRRIVERRRSTRPNEPIFPIFLLDAVRDRVPTLAEPPADSRRSSQSPRSADFPDYFDARRWAATPDFERRYDVVLGNPPWIAWDRLSDEYREATKDRWRERGLFTLSGSAALRGGGKKELAGLLVYETLDRRLRDGGVLAFVVPKSLFQSREAGNGFRRFGSNPDASKPTPFRVLEIDDFSDAPLFSGVASKFATFCARRGEPTRPPIPIRRWRATRLSDVESSTSNAPN
ncbi:MAG: SAM-dependent DNA methyltransferase, partial [Thermoguttaceae bacterium]|nr:SAM-dependent DNA methyltransferase [Thermoguttaceae bacterium]